MSNDNIKAGAILQSYDNLNGECNCSVCELARLCDCEGRYQRLPRLTNQGALGLCPKLAGNESSLKRLIKAVGDKTDEQSTQKSKKNQPDGVGCTAD